jgi:hypothetical protein
MKRRLAILLRAVSRWSRFGGGVGVGVDLVVVVVVVVVTVCGVMGDLASARS